MAKEDIVIGIKTQVEGDMGKTLDTLDSKVKDVTKSIDKLGDTEEKAGKQSKEAGKSFAKSANEVAKGIGIYKLAEGALNILKDAFMSNGEASQFLGGIMEGLNVLLQEVVGAIVQAISSVSEATNGFEGLSKVMGGVLTIALQTLRGAFYGIKLAILEVMKIWEESPFGSGDTSTIAKLTTDIENAKEVLVDVGEKMKQGGTDIVDNLGKAVDELTMVVDKSVQNIEKVDVKAAMAKGKRMKALEDSAKMAEAAAGRLTAKYETQGEKLRQIRDDDTKSIAERTDANNKLAEVLDKQEKSLLAGADAQIAAAKARVGINNTIDNQVALTNALAAKDQVLADIEGKRSEQKQNEVNLRKESLALSQAEIDKNTEVALKQQQNTTARIKDEEQRLVQQKADLETEKGIELQRLQDKIDSAKEGTLARVEAEKEYALKKVEIDNQIATTDDQINEVRLGKTKERLTKELQATIDSEKEKAAELVAGSPARLEAERAILQTQLDYYTEHKAELFKTDEEYAAKKKEIEKQITENERAEQEARKQNAFAVVQEVLGGFTQFSSAIGQLDQATTENKLKGVKKGSEEEKRILKESFERQKKLSIATTLINGAQAIVAALSVPDPTFGILTGIRIAFAAATTAAQVAAIQSKQFDGGGGTPPSTPPPDTSAGGGDAPTTSAPSTMGLGTVNIASRRQELQFQQVYVVESDIRGVMNRVETIENRSVLGS